MRRDYLLDTMAYVILTGVSEQQMVLVAANRMMMDGVSVLRCCV